MIGTILYFILALLGIGFLIFIHELGHYFMAKRAGIIVEEFAIGFGKALIQWERNGVKWKVGWIPVGGYVKMAGMEKKGLLEPYQIEGGFFAAKPWARIKVAVMGPVVNIVFALFAFTLLWAAGGRLKPFSEYTRYIGWIQPESGPYAAHIRSGDEITKLNGRKFKGFNDFLYGVALDNQALMIQGYEIDYVDDTKTPFTYTFTQDGSTDAMEKASEVAQALSPAQYLIYDKILQKYDNPIPSGSPWDNSGIEYGDRILWANGGLIFSKKQLIQVLNNPRVLLTVQRDNEIFLTSVPRLQVRDLRISENEKNEIDDWAHEAKIAKRIDQINFIPYGLSADGTVESVLGYIDENAETRVGYEVADRVPAEKPLMPGDKILAVQGQPISNSYELLSELQLRKNLVIVKKGTDDKPLRFDNPDQGFLSSFDIKQLQSITNTIGTSSPLDQTESLKLLKPLSPQITTQSPPSDEPSEGEPTTGQEKSKVLKQYLKYQNRQMLGLVLQDKRVVYNPNPFVLFGEVFKEVYRTFFALITGYLSPKYMSGPIGIVQVIQYSWSVGVKEALFWLGMISLNLGILNLLPIPPFDGGHIMFSIWEAITKKPIKAKTMERLILPFVILIIAFFVYLTYNDIARIITNLF